MPPASQSADRLSRLIQAIHGRNPFYTQKLDAAGIRPGELHFPSDLARLPLTTKGELVADQQSSPPWGTNLTEPLDRYTRYNQTSSTTGTPLRWLDTNESWQWMLDCWKAVYRAARVGERDRIFFPFSFGPFLGFWTAFEAGCQIGAHCIPAGGMSSHARLELIDTLAPTVMCCTPTYALRLLEVAAEVPGGCLDPSSSSVRVIIVAGEPGGSIASTRERIEKGWGARVIDHHGLTEVGPDQLRVLGVAGLPASQRGRVHLRSARAWNGTSGGRRRARRAGRHEPRARGEPADSLSHWRCRRAANGSLPLRADARASRRWHPGPRRRHGDRARCQRVSVRDRGGRASLRRGRGVPRDRDVPTARCASSRSRSSCWPGSMRRRRVAGRSAPPCVSRSA